MIEKDIEMNILVVIPARGGSKEIPRKNLRLLVEKPLLYYSIYNALNSKYNLDVFVSSDDDEPIIVNNNRRCQIPTSPISKRKRSRNI